MNDWAIWIALAGGLLGGFFAANNHALLHFSRSRLEEILRQRGREQAMLSTRQEHDLILLTAVIRAALNLVVLMMTILWFDPMGREAPFWALIWAFLVAGAIIVVLGVAVPLSWGRHAAEPLLIASLPLLRLLDLVSRPVLISLRWLDPVMRRLLGVRDEQAEDYSPLEQEILDAVSEGEKAGHVDEVQKEMIEAVVEFPTTNVDEIMTPRTDVVGIEVDSGMARIKQIIAEAGFSRYPVYEGDLDHVVGMLYVKDLLPLVGASGDDAFDLRSAVREALFVPESKTVADLLTEFQARKVHIALVLDEYGGTAGLVTIEDIVEEIVGEIEDEYDPADQVEPSITRLSPTAAEVDARVHIDDLNDELELNLPESEDYETVGGFVFSSLGHIPEPDETFEVENVRITVLEAERTKVKRLRVEVVGSATRTLDQAAG